MNIPINNFLLSEGNFYKIHKIMCQYLIFKLGNWHILLVNTSLEKDNSVKHVLLEILIVFRVWFILKFSDYHTILSHLSIQFYHISLCIDFDKFNIISHRLGIEVKNNLNISFSINLLRCLLRNKSWWNLSFELQSDNAIDIVMISQ